MARPFCLRFKPHPIMLECRTVAAVAQLDRVLGSEPRGRGFESCQPHHLHLSH